MRGELYTRSFQISTFALKKAVEGMTGEQSLRHLDEGGNCVNWILGHLLAARNRGIALLGAEPFWPAGKLAAYAKGSAGFSADRSGAVSLAELLEGLETSSVVLEQALRDAPDPAFDKPNPNPTPFLGDTVGTAITALAFHEAYHAGQIGLLRKQLGMPAAFG